MKFGKNVEIMIATPMHSKISKLFDHNTTITYSTFNKWSYTTTIYQKNYVSNTKYINLQKSNKIMNRYLFSAIFTLMQIRHRYQEVV